MNKNTLFNIGMLLALIAGVMLGIYPIPGIQPLADTISKLFINMLKLISLPMIFLAIVSTLTRMTSMSEAGILVKKILKYTIITTLIAATIGMLSFLMIQPINDQSAVTQTFAFKGTYLSFLTNIIPENIMQPFLENNVLGMAFIGIILSIAVLKLPNETNKVLKDFFGALFDALLKITSSLILLMPIGIFAFTIQFVHSIQKESQQLKKLLFYGLCVIAANLIQGLIILPVMLKLKGVSPLKTAKGMFPALVMAFFSKSSNATLPLSIDCAKNRLGLSEQTVKFSFPLCSIINMNGCAAFILITIFFICGCEGISLTIGEMIPWVFLATLAAIGNAGVPMGCFFLTTAFLIGMGIPIEKMGLILPLYSLFDMVETALNVWSDSCITATIDHELKSNAPLLKIPSIV